MNRLLIWRVCAVAGIISFLMVVVQIWVAPFPEDFYSKLVGTWTALIVTMVVLKFLESTLDVGPAKTMPTLSPKVQPGDSWTTSENNVSTNPVKTSL